jgi:hypothetical protein
MDEHDSKTCPLCAATKRVFGDRFDGCASFSNDLALEATKLMRKKTDELLAELEAKRGVSDEDYQLVKKSIKHSFAFAASNVPSLALISGAECDPPTMMQLVQANMVHLVQSIFERRLEREGPGVLAELLGMILERRGNDPNMN